MYFKLNIQFYAINVLYIKLYIFNTFCPFNKLVFAHELREFILTNKPLTSHNLIRTEFYDTVPVHKYTE